MDYFQGYSYITQIYLSQLIYNKNIFFKCKQILRSNVVSEAISSGIDHIQINFVISLVFGQDNLQLYCPQADL